MNIVEGQLPEGKLWRALVLLAPDHKPAVGWQLGRQLAESHGGEMVAAMLITETGAAKDEAARRLFQKLSENGKEEAGIFPILIEARDVQAALATLVASADIDVVVAESMQPEWHSLERLTVPVIVVRGAAGDDNAREAPDEDAMPRAIRKILVPTAGGPNTAVALGILVPLGPEVTITMLYVVREGLSEEEEAHGRGRLRQLARFVDGQNELQRKVITAASPMAGIVAEASGPYDLVVVGATRENTLARALFGDVVGNVVRQSRTPVAVIRDAGRPMGTLGRTLAWRLQKVLPRLDLSRRTEVYTRIRRSARPDTDFFILIGLSALIAALGLLLDSAAVVIGAMLVAPLMSPIIGAGLAIVMGNIRFLRLSFASIVRGALLAVFLSVLLGLLRRDAPMTAEVLSRTEPTLLDLGVALFAGMAGAYALANSQVAAALPGVAIAAALVPPLAAIGISLASGAFREALGATLLFTTNLIAIIGAAVLVFVAVGFRPAVGRKAAREIQQRTVRLAFALLLSITLLLGVTTYRLARESFVTNRVQEVTQQHVDAMDGVTFDNLVSQHLGDASQPLQLDVTVRSTYPIPYAEVERLRDAIATELAPVLGEEREIALTLTVIRVTRLDPAAPPTPTAEPTLPAP